MCRIFMVGHSKALNISEETASLDVFRMIRAARFRSFDSLSKLHLDVIHVPQVGEPYNVVN